MSEPVDPNAWSYAIDGATNGSRAERRTYRATRGDVAERYYLSVTNSSELEARAGLSRAVEDAVDLVRQPIFFAAECAAQRREEVDE